MSDARNADDGDGSGVVTTAHGAGGGRMRELVDDLVVSRFDGGTDTPSAGVGLSALDDGAALPVPDVGGDASVVTTTDSHVVKPLEFPGGDIGRLAVSGTVNDLAVMGATEPLALTCALLVEEGTDRALLDRVMGSLEAACAAAGVEVVTGDTKVLPSGDLDTLAVNTTGVGVVPTGEHVSDAGLRPGDKIVVSGTVGDHGIALLSEREGFDVAGDLASDVAPLNGLVAAAMDAGRVTAMKDPTRGGFATAVTEMAEKAGVGATVRERDVPVADAVAAAGELLGIDPLDVANEGVVVFGVAPEDADDVVAALRDHPEGRDAAVVGEATADHAGRVVLDTGLGRRYLTEPDGEQYPRIC
jgi:hydrogenase expression/formation protein HypE